MIIVVVSFLFFKYKLLRLLAEAENGITYSISRQSER